MLEIIKCGMMHRPGRYYGWTRPYGSGPTGKGRPEEAICYSAFRQEAGLGDEFKLKLISLPYFGISRVSLYSMSYLGVPFTDRSNPTIAASLKYSQSNARLVRSGPGQLTLCPINIPCLLFQLLYGLTSIRVPTYASRRH